jgi:hypothetical protein
MSFLIHYYPDVMARNLYANDCDFPDDYSRHEESYMGECSTYFQLISCAMRSKTNYMKALIANDPSIVDKPKIAVPLVATPLFWSLFSKESIDKIIECAQVLINAGEDFNMCMMDNEDNLLGACVEMLDLKKLPDFVEKGSIYISEKGWIERKLEDVKTMAAFLVSQGATCQIGKQDKLTENQSAVLNEIRECAAVHGIGKNWSHLRLVYLGSRSDSPIADCPTELLNLISKAIIEQSFQV